MKNSQFEAKTFGVGELIMQRKLFVVPPHQRSYAWGKEAIDEFFDDIETARSNGAADYFIGLIVIQGSPEGEWILLDGQQRLSTVSLIYSAIRYWFHAAGFVEDAKQINHDYLGVRRLGGDYTSRMVLNAENRETFEIATNTLLSDRELLTRSQSVHKKSSNRLLLDAAVAARKWVNELAGEKSSHNTEGADVLYALARFLEQKLKVVAVEVSSEVDAYVLFEALNDRGVALSALDLIKNYIFSKHPAGQEEWDQLIANLDAADPEDFLKVFWTSRYGNIQKSQIFRGVKDRYGDAHAAGVLLKEMKTDAVVLSALSDDDHPYWEKRDRGLRDQIYLLRYLDSKQARPVVIAILRVVLDPMVARQMLGVLSSALFRFQVVGRGRTGVVEKVIGRLCAGIQGQAIQNVQSFVNTIEELITPDSEFETQLMSYTDYKYSRIAYVLAEDAFFQVHGQSSSGYVTASSDGGRAAFVRSVVARTQLSEIYPTEGEGMSEQEADALALVGNFKLVPNPSAVDLVIQPAIQKVNEDLVAGIKRRTSEFAARATEIWSPKSWGG